jgi:hypothetical protein
VDEHRTPGLQHRPADARSLRPRRYATYGGIITCEQRRRSTSAPPQEKDPEKDQRNTNREVDEPHHRVQVIEVLVEGLEHQSLLLDAIDGPLGLGGS